MTKDELLTILALDVGDCPRVDEFTWPLIVAFVAEWIADVHDLHDDALAERWREEMAP